MNDQVTVTGVERFFEPDEIIVSKTDLKGAITYANRVFLKIADYTEQEVLGAPHSIVRHPDMPRCVFKLLWDTIQAGNEIFAYVVNRAKNGDHYWVLAHVTPSFNASGTMIGYHSNRRVPDRKVLTETIIPLYQNLLQVEQSNPNRKVGMEASFNTLVQALEDMNLSYDEFIFSLGNSSEAPNAAAA
ncbi:MAG: PAS domain-containing protein [Rhodospirillales bacterium]|jgi:PAS domain S-box-containing protein|nr:PAS domain-containing protein [Rhodospirillales bacterium]MDP6645974.1 PAS domain-containing protein [Rhodospirillales bacterium]MDP6842894.1 PAS domain-containing protein [Rhodospirillales bacterium]|tara:strand:- start:64 stop:624 length:561 start_codon:yes stop_codon:yes gene_type:complete